MTSDQAEWNARYREGDGEPVAAEVLRRNLHLLPSRGVALDLACGLGGNALLLADRGLETHAWDVSDVAVARLAERAQGRGLALQTQVRDVVASPPPSEGFDVIVVSRFLDRGLAPALVEALRPEGLLFYQTFTLDKATPAGPSNPRFLLAPNELLSLFAPLRVLVYREEGRVGNLEAGFRSEAMFIGMRERAR